MKDCKGNTLQVNDKVIFYCGGNNKSIVNGGEYYQYLRKERMQHPRV